MLAALALSLTLLGPGAQTPNSAAGKGQNTADKVTNPAAELVSKMLAYYAEAKSMTGTITLTATANGQGNAQLVTTLQYELPSKLYISQVNGGPHLMRWLVTSDGKSFSYDRPDNLPLAPRQRLVEPVYQAIPTELNKDGTYVHRNYTVKEIYAVVARDSLGDRSVPLDIAIGRRDNLAHDDLTWMTVESGGKTTLNGVQANIVNGKWREFGNEATDLNHAPGNYQMVITDEGRLLQYTISYLVGDLKGVQAMLRETWDVDLTVNGKPDERLFQLVR